MPGLHRLLLINTHLPGVVELRLDGHTNICGTNASGKTTLQRLVPVFYGELPSRVVPIGRDSFERWYLPTQQSFIVYEYDNHAGGRCQAVLSPASDGQGVEYRLVGKAFVLDDYVKSRDDEALSLFTIRELAQEMKRAGIECSRRLNISEYRAIIQNDTHLPGLDGNRVELRAYIREFSLCTAHHSLRHIEKLVRTVHSKEGKMETLRQMIAAILEEEGVSTPQSRLKVDKVEVWRRECALILEFNRLRPDYQQMAQRHDELIGCERRLSTLVTGYRSDETLQYQRQQQAQALSEEMDFALKRLDGQWRDDQDGLQQELSALRATIKQHEQDLDEVEQRYQRYLDSGIEDVRADLERIPVWTAHRDALGERYRLLTEKHQDVNASFHQRRSEISEQLNQALERLQSRLEEAQAALEVERDRRRDDVERVEGELRAGRQLGEQKFGERRQALELRHFELKHRADSMGQTDDERLRLAVLDSRVEEAAALQDQADEQVRRLEQTLQTHQRSREQKLQAVTGASAVLLQRQQALEVIEALLSPAKNSVLEFLRREQPGWEHSLGRIIRPELLQRSDLKPALAVDSAAGAYGVSFDLAAIELPDCAQSEQELQRSLHQAQEGLKAAENEQHGAGLALTEAARELKAAETALTQARTTTRQRQDDVRRLREEKRLEADRVSAALTERRLAALKQLEDVEKDARTLESEYQGWCTEREALEREARMECKLQWDERLGEGERQLTTLKDEMSVCRARAKGELDACERWYHDELRKRGVDESEVSSLRQNIKQVSEQIRRTEDRRGDVRDYEHWLTRDWLQRKPQLQEQLSAQRGELALATQSLHDARAHYRHERGALEIRREQARKDEAEARQNLERLRFLLKKIQDLRLPSADEEERGDIGERLRLGDELLHSRAQLQDEVSAKVQKFDYAIAGKSGTGLAEFWEKSRAEALIFGDAVAGGQPDPRKLVHKLDELMNQMVPQYEAALVQQGRTFGIDLNAYYDVLADIEQRIAGHSRRISAEVEQELSLDGVSDSSVRIRSRIQELEFWPELKDFVSAFRQWQDKGFSGLPSEDYAASLKRALDIIGRSALTGGIVSLLDIELKLREGRSELLIRTDLQLANSSSHGMAYLILCKYLLAFTRLLRGAAPVTLHWPIDELGTLHASNVKKVFDACRNNDISILGAFPNPEHEVLALFSNRYLINKQTRQLQVVKPQVDTIAEKLKARRLLAQEAN